MEQRIILDSFIKDVQKRIAVGDIPKIDKSYVHKVNSDYVLISEINEIPLEFLTKEATEKFGKHRYLYTVAMPKYDCLFCFDHELDHLPFIMTIELIRQAGVATAHAIHGVPLTGYSNIMDNITMNLQKFIELDVPLIMILDDVMIKNRKSRQERELHFYLFQNDSLCATIDINALVMEKDLYFKLRLNSRGDLVKRTELCKEPRTNIQMLGFQKNNKKVLYND